MSEDRILSELVSVFGNKKVDWQAIGRSMGRTPRQCRDRYKNYLSCELERRGWTREEDELLRERVGEMGCHWARMTDYFPGRSDVSLKNRWRLLSHRKNVDERLHNDGDDVKATLEISEVQYAFYKDG